jgi:hypothetical protein
MVDGPPERGDDDTATAQERRRLAVVAAGVLVLLVVVLVLVVVVLPPRFTAHRTFDKDHEELKAQNDVRTTLLQGLAAVLVLTGAAIGAAVTLRQIRISQGQLQATREQMQHTLETAQQQLNLIEQGQVTDRYTKAVEQLRADNQPEVAIGGIYALERIARDSSDYRPIIAEILAAYVRSHAPWSESRPDQDEAEDTLQTRAPNVQAALAVLGGTTDIELNLRHTDLRNADLKKAKFKDVRLYDANLQRARLQDADLRGARFYNANLQDAQLQRADLRGARLYNANLQGAQLEGADLRGAQLNGANFQGAHQLDRATLRGALADDTTTWPAGFDHSAAGVLPSEGATADRPP